ncbi:MAG: GNAT family N-acetyltransferase [Clostridia bacterium]|nr:GNAT family N-acetyltransferase [Clostridia bacterium]
MIFEEKALMLKDGRTAILKTPAPEDAEMMLAFIRAACGETEFLLRNPEEWDPVTPEDEAKWIRGLRESPQSFDIACYVDGVLIGNCELRFRQEQKCAHRAELGIAIREAFWGLGIGSAMFAECITAARAHGTTLLELTHKEGNDRGRRLYEKFGFRQVCIRPKAFRMKDGRFCGEVFMQMEL